MMNFQPGTIPYGIELIFIPDYIVNALKSRDITMEDIDNAFEVQLRNFVMNKYDGVKSMDIPNKAGEILRNKLSKVDLDDLQIFNEMSVWKMRKWNTSKTFICTVLERPAFAVSDEVINNTLLSLYDNNMSISIDKLFSTYIGSNCLYVILHKGFTNFVIDNNLDLKFNVFSAIMDKVVSNFGEDRFTKSVVFRDYVELLRLKYKD